jgi:hypothetical protein
MGAFPDYLFAISKNLVGDFSIPDFLISESEKWN